MEEILRDMAYARLRQADKDENLCNKILTTMDGDGPRRVVLTGKSGIGKTRLAKMVGEHATRRGLCYQTICLHLNNKFEDQLSLYENIAFQIGAYNGDDKEEKKPEDMLTDLKEKISAKLQRKYTSTVEKRNKFKRPETKFKRPGKKFPVSEEKHTVSPVKVRMYLLLILDDEGNKTSEDKVMKDFGLEKFLIDNCPGDSLPLKLLITRRKGEENTTKPDRENESHATHEPQGTESEIESIVAEEEQIESPTTDMSEALLNTIDELNLQDLFRSLVKDKTMELLMSLQNDWKIDEPLISLVVRKSITFPAAIVVLAKSLNCITHQNTFRCLSSKQEKVLKEALFSCEAAYSLSGHNLILQLAYQLLETDATLNNAIIDCFWHSLDFFKHCSGIHCNELITQWILEGYFDPVRSVKKAYNDGHAILVELLKRGILKIQKGDMVIPEMAMNNLIDLRHHGLLGRSQLRFARVDSSDKKRSLGKVTQLDDMIKTVQANKGDKVSTILVSGNRLRRETPEDFFEKLEMEDLEVVGLFYPTLDSLVKSLRGLKQLRVLVIRDYDILPSMEEIKDLKSLEVLEVSGASSVETISDDFFKEVPKLQTLNLSRLKIRHSPSSISQLKCLHSLILRDCPLLEDLPDIQELEKLEVVDVRGAHNLKTCFGKRIDTRRNQSFSRLQQLQHIDFSESRIKRLPVFHDAAVADNLHSLTRLSLQNCAYLIKLPNLKPLSGLQILDFSGTTSLVEIAAVCFEQKEELKILNLSGTKLSRLPFTISGLSNLCQLLLRDSSNLEVLPNIEGLTSLEIFDVSGCTKLHTIEGSFKGMSYLRKVRLSGTRIKTLPELPDESRIFCSKLIILADSRRWIYNTWEQVKEAITNGMSESLSSSDTVNEIQEISRKESEREDEHWAFDCPEKEGGRREHFHQGQIYRSVYMNTIPFVDNKSCQEVLEIRGSNGVDQDKETLAKSEFVAFVDDSAASLSSIFNEMKSVKGCWVEMCSNIKILFSDVDEECHGSLETLSITNLCRLDSICSSSFKNLKKLSLDSCPSIKTLFPASQEPTSLEVLNIKFCEKLEKVFEEEVELPNLHTLSLFELPVLSTFGAKLPNLERYKDDKCPQLKTSKENLREGILHGLDRVTM